MKNDYGGSHTPKEIKDLWQTPKPVFRGMDREFEFVADVAANKANALIPRYITEEMDTLHYPWGAVAMPGEYVWMNPPYSNPGPFVDKAALEHSRNHIGCVMLLPADISVLVYERHGDGKRMPINHARAAGVYQCCNRETSKREQ